MKNQAIQILSQPLLTEDGFVNEACVNELAAAIKNIPPIHERMADDPEWTAKRWTFPSDITGGLAKWAIRQSPYGCPDNLESVVKYLGACLKTSVVWDVGGMAELSLCDIARMLYEILYEQGVSHFDAWNVRKREPTEEERMFSSDNRSPDTDFIDLDALLTNVCIDIRTDLREHDRFNAEFDRKYGDQPRA